MTALGMRARFALCCATALVAALGASGSTAAEPSDGTAHGSRAEARLDREPSCNALPDELPVLPASTARPQRLHVRVLVEKRDAALARRLAASTVQDFKKINIHVSLSWDAPPSFQLQPNLGGRFVQPETLFDAMRRRYLGVRPPGVDAVYLFTRQHPSGQADCIGGILRNDRGFAFGPLAPPDDTTVSTTRTPQIATHELGHLLGAYHEDANCAESASSTASGMPGCTIMFPSISLITSTFSTIETARMRQTLARLKEQRPGGS